MKKILLKKQKFVENIICIILLAFLNYYWFYDIGEKVFLIGDDVRFFNYIKASDHVIRTVFTNEIGTYRPVPYFLMMILIKIFGTSSSIYFYANLALNFAIMMSIFYITYRLCNQRLPLSFSAAVFYVTAIYSYYGITQLLGFMELMCLLWAVWFFYFLIKYIEYRSNKYYLYSVAAYFLITFSHERFLVLFGVYAVLNLFLLYDDQMKNRIGRLLASAVPAVILIFLKLFVFQVPLLVGTGQIKIQFDILSIIKFLCQSILSILGIHVGPQYLFGYSFLDCNTARKISILFVSASVFFVFFLYGYQKIFKNQVDRKSEIQKMLLFLFTEGAAILCYAVSSRIEMRELYVPYTFLILFTMYGAGKIEIWNSLRQVLLFTALFVTSVNHYVYQVHTGQLFFMEAMRIGKSAYEAVVSLQEPENCKIYIPNHGDLVWALLLTDQRDIFYMHDLDIDYELYDESENIFEKLQGIMNEEKDIYVMYMEHNSIQIRQVYGGISNTKAVGENGHENV